MIGAAAPIENTLAVELREVTVRRGARVLLDRVDLSLEVGASRGIVGPNGSGKSALLRVVAGLCRPASGEVRVHGLRAREQPSAVRRAVGYAGDDDGLAERLTAAEHLMMVAVQRGLRGADARAAVESMLELVDLTGPRNEPVRALSRGQRRRLVLALALVHDPPIILLDEPMSQIDETGRGELISILQELRSMGKTLLIASPAQAEIAEVCESVSQVVAGRLQAPSQLESVELTWVEVVGEVEPALRVLREHPRVDGVVEESGFVSFRGPTNAEERARILDVLIGNGVRLAGFGATYTAVGGRG